MSALSPAAEPQQMVFSQSVDGLFIRALGEEMPEALRLELKQLGLDLGKILPAYPVTLWNQAVEVTAKALYPDLPLETAARRLGERMIEGYQNTVVGKAVLAMARLIGPRRALLRSRQNWRSGNNYTEVHIVEISPQEFRMTFNEKAVSKWVSQGLLYAGLKFAGANALQVEVERFTDNDATYHITWS
jgi:uncharacterized protein (TIGR02265 family)